MTGDATLRISIENLLEGIQVIGYDWTYLYLNETAAKHGQRSADDLLRRTMMECYPGIEQTPLFGTLQRVMRTRRAERLVNEFVYADGQRAWFELLVEPVPDGICVLSLDVTERRATELRLQQAQKMEAIGRLAGGVAHDFNNLLTAILGYGQLALEQVSDPAVAADIAEIQAAGERAARLTRQLLAFSRRSGLQPEVLDLNLLVRDFQPMIERLIGDVHVQLAIGAASPWVRADRGQIEQVLLNLAVNARDAMPQGGTLRIATRNAEVDAPLAARHRGAKPGTHVALSVQDTGSGIDAETLQHVFDPFFTTKGPDEGTGIGLSTVQSVAQQSEGFVAIESEVGVGTTVTMYLPVAQPAALAAADERANGRTAASETILLVGNDAAVQRLIRRTLEACGYTVLDARDAAHAAALADTHDGPVHLLITDFILPGLHGSHLAQAVVSRHPASRVLYVSGYPDTRAHESGHVSARVSLLPKPFTPATLVARVRASLDGQV